MKQTTKKRFFLLSENQKLAANDIMCKYYFPKFSEALRLIISLGLTAQQLECKKYSVEIGKPCYLFLTESHSKAIDNYIFDHRYHSISGAFSDIINRGLEVEQEFGITKLTKQEVREDAI